MGFLDRVLGDLMQDTGGRHARRLLRRVGGKKLLLAGGVAAADAILNPSTGAPRGSGYGFTKGDAVATATPPPAVPPSGLPPVPGVAAGTGLPRGSAQPLSGTAGESPAGRPAHTSAGAAPAGVVPPAPSPTVAPLGTGTVPPPPAAAPSPVSEMSGAVPAPPPALVGATGEGVVEAVDLDALELAPALTFAAVRTMISAALSDGHLGAEERDAVEARLSEAELSAEEVDRIHKDLLLPASPRELADLSQDEDDRQLLYQLAVAVVAADGQVLAPERDWLLGLGTAFELSAEAVSALEADVLDELAVEGDGSADPAP